MKLITSGIVTNQYGHVLLIQRDDSLTWAPPGGILEHGELPTEGVVREVREETGLMVTPVRLVALDFAKGKNDTLLLMTFRCIQRGGEIKTSGESLRVGWVKGNDLPRSMLSYHRQRVERALAHAGGPPVWHVEENGGNRLHRLKRALTSIGKRKQQPGDTNASAPDWEIETAVRIQNSKNETLWVKSGQQWVLPGALSNGKQPPWATAVQATQSQTGHTPTLTTLAGVYAGEKKLTLVFWGAVPAAAIAQDDNVKFSFEAPDNADSVQAGWIRSAVTAEDVTIFL